MGIADPALGPQVLAVMLQVKQFKLSCCVVSCSARLEKAGAYLVHATISNNPVAASPELLHVQPASASAKRYRF